MVTDKQARRLFMLNDQGMSIEKAALKTGMSENSARKYLKIKKLPTQTKKQRNYNTRENPFIDVWEEIKQLIINNKRIQAKTIIKYLKKVYPGKFKDNQLRTLQRKIKEWKALEGPPKEVYFPQIHYPGDLSETDFTHMTDLCITINGERFEHLIYHFVLTYSNWESGTICFSETYESLSNGFQNALFELGFIPKRHRTDCLSATLKRHYKKEVDRNKFTDRYNSLMRYYDVEVEKTNPYSPNENGDVEKSHDLLKNAIEQALILRGSFNFNSRDEYQIFILNLINDRNRERDKKFSEEIDVMRPLLVDRLDDCKLLEVRVTKYSTIRVASCVYSVHSRLIGEEVKVKLYSEYLEVWYSNKLIEKIPRQKGCSKYYIQYCHIIDWLIRKPGAFENYKYKSDLFPNTRFRIAYDYYRTYIPSRANKDYLKILYLASKEGESLVDDALRYSIDNEKSLLYKCIASIVLSKKQLPDVRDINISEVNLSLYDELLKSHGGA